MRIISGIYKGRKIKSSDDLSIRPTTDRVKELIFNVLQDFPEGKIVLDLFSGSGSLGLEALSRGAKKVYFVDSSNKSLNILKQNIHTIGIPEDQYVILKQTAIDFARNAQMPLDLLLLDPPFKYAELQVLVDTLLQSPVMSTKSLLVLEHETINPIESDSDVYDVLIQKKMGRSLISFLVRKNERS